VYVPTVEQVETHTASKKATRYDT